MKHLFTSIAFLFVCYSYSQSFSSPESVEYDPPRNRYIVANTSANNLQSVVPGSAPTLFKSGVTSPYGLVIVGDTVYVCSQGGYIRAYNLTNGNAAGNVNTGGSFLNGICTDFAGNIYATDFSSTPKKIYRMSIATQQFNVFATNLPKTPNGIVFDPFNNRLVVATWGPSASILGVSLADSSVTTLKTTTLSNIDGISIDGDGNFYIAEWGGDDIYFFDNQFLNAPLLAGTATGTNPADIHYNVYRDTLAVPNTSANTVTYYGFPRPVVTNDVDTVCVDSVKSICVLANDYAPHNTPILLSNYTSPANGTINLVNNCLSYNALSLGTETVTYTVCTNGTPSFCKTGTVNITTVSCGSQQAQALADFTVTSAQFNNPCGPMVYTDTIELTSTSSNADSIFWSISLDGTGCNSIVYNSSAASLNFVPEDVWGNCDDYNFISVCLTAINSTSQNTKCDTTCGFIWGGVGNTALSGIRFFPNPASDVITIDMRQANEDITQGYTHIDITGSLSQLVKTIARQSDNQMVHIQIRDLPAGIYNAVLVGSDNQRRGLGRFTVQK